MLFYHVWVYTGRWERSCTQTCFFFFISEMFRGSEVFVNRIYACLNLKVLQYCNTFLQLIGIVLLLPCVSLCLCGLCSTRLLFLELFLCSVVPKWKCQYYMECNQVDREDTFSKVTVVIQAKLWTQPPLSWFNVHPVRSLVYIIAQEYFKLSRP